MGNFKKLKWIGVFPLILALWVGWKIERNNGIADAGQRTIPKGQHFPVPPATTTIPTSSPNSGHSGLGKDAAKRSGEEIMQDLHDAAVTYDPAQLTVICPYLTHSDPAIRAAAANAMVMLGDASAAPMLRKAATSLGPSDEAKSLEKCGCANIA